MKNSVFGFFFGMILTTTALAQELPSVFVVASDALAAEPPGVVNAVDTGVFTISRQGPTNFPLMVFFALGGTASNSVDYLKIESPITIAEGSRSARVTVVPLPDDLVEGDERVILRIVGSPIVGPGSGYILPTNSLGAVVTIRDYRQEPTNSLPSVDIVRPGNSAVFAAPANITIAAQTVDANGWVPKVEFFANENKIGESILNFVVAPDDGTPITHEFHWNGVPAGQYTLTARGTDDQGATRTSAPIRISVNESNVPTRTVVSIVATDAEGREIPEVPPGMGMPQMNDPAIFTVSRTGNVSNALTVYYTVGGTAMNGVDYVELSGQVEIPAGQRSAEIEVDVIDDRIVEGTETVRIQVVPPPCIAVEPPPPECYIVGGRTGEGVVLTFDDLDPGNDGLPGPDYVPVPNGYGGLSWNYFDVLNGTLMQPDYGYHRGTISPSNVVFNVAGEPATIRSVNGVFDLGSAYLTSAINIDEPMHVQVVGLVAGLVVYDNTFTLTRTPLLAQFNYRGIDEARFISSPPRPFAMDNLAIGVGAPSLAEARILDNDVAPSNRPPVVSIVQPTNGAVFLAPAEIEIVASAFDSDGYVATVQFYAGTNRIGVATNNPFSAGVMNPFHIRWSNVLPGEYILTAVATDDRGAQSRSAPVRIAVLQQPNDQTVVNIRAIDSEAAEQDPRLDAPQNNALLRVTRSGRIDYDLEVRYRLAGTASNGVDYARLTGQVVIPTGSEFADIVIEAIDDKLVERTESVVASIVPPVCAAIYPPPRGCYVVGPAGSATAFILDDEPFETNSPPHVEITRPAGGATYRAPADVHIVASTVDRDGYVGKVEFFANDHKIGEASKDFFVAPTNGSPIIYEIDWNGVAPGQYALTARAIDNRGAVGISTPVRITVTGTNEPPPPSVAVVTVYAIDGYASEGGLIYATNEPIVFGTNVSRPPTNVAVFEIRRAGGSTDNALRVFYEMHGTATEGVDYLDLPEVAEIPVGQRSARVVVTPIDDQLAEKLESVVICLRPSPLANLLSDYVVGQPSQAGAVIADNDTPPMRCTALSDGVFHLCQPAPDGQCFRIEGSSDLQNWTILGTVAAVDGAVRYADAQGPAYERRFYRAIPVPCPTEQP